MHVQSDDHWEVKLYGLKVGETEIEFNADKVVLDSGASHCYVPTKAYKSIMKEITKGKDCSLDKIDGLVKCKCSGIDSSFKTIKMELGSILLMH